MPNIVYEPNVYLFDVTGSATALTFRSSDSGASGTALDNVRVAAVPEPATCGMTIMGFGILGSSLRRRRTATLAAA